MDSLDSWKPVNDLVADSGLRSRWRPSHPPRSVERSSVIWDNGETDAGY
jgi:hypothetical protein